MTAPRRIAEILLRPEGLVLAAALFVLSPPPCASEIYQWEDDQGTVHFTDELSAVPAPSRGKAQILLREAPITVEAPPPESYGSPPESVPAPEPGTEAEGADAGDPATQSEALRAKISAKEQLIDSVDAKRSRATNPLRNRFVSPTDMELYRKYQAELPGDRERLKELESRIDSLNQ